MVTVYIYSPFPRERHAPSEKKCISSLIGGLGPSRLRVNPSFLISPLSTTGTVGAGTGWLPRHEKLLRSPSSKDDRGSRWPAMQAAPARRRAIVAAGRRSGAGKSHALSTQGTEPALGPSEFLGCALPHRRNFPDWNVARNPRNSRDSRPSSTQKWRFSAIFGGNPENPMSSMFLFSYAQFQSCKHEFN